MAVADAKTKTKTKKKISIGVDHTIYTAILGLALLSLAATVGYVCYYNYSVYGAVFGVTAP
ncbi:MAG: hypothetical protein JW936_09865 [Sedimentisphaerales bacterium]|nr:hypothetical protein [Sedimentisphaerales bacterium]